MLGSSKGAGASQHQPPRGRRRWQAIDLPLACLAALAFTLPAWVGSLSFAWTALSGSDSNFDWGKAPPGPLFTLSLGLASWLPRLQAALLPPHLTAMLVATGFAPSKALYALAELGIADELAAGPLPVAVLSERKGVKADALARLMRAVGSHGIFAEVSPGVFANNRGSSVLRSDHPSSLRNMILVWGDESYWAHQRVLDSLQPGSPPAFELQTGGVPYFQWLAKPDNEARSERFNEAMVEAAAAVNAATLQDYPWARHANQTLSDVGGGLGGFLSSLLASQPGMRGLLVDLPPVAADAERHWRERHAGLLGRVRIVPGDFFRELPPADIHFFRLVLHDWADEQAVRILRTVRASVPAGAEADTLLLIQDLVLPPRGARLSPIFAALDLQMLAIAGGKERMLDEWQALLAAAGFRLQAVHRLRTLTAIIEARPV